jgi:hypothetical protein
VSNTVVDRVTIDVANEGPLKVARASRHDVGDVVTLLSEHAAERECADVISLSNLHTQVLFRTGDGHRWIATGLGNADRRRVLLALIGRFDVPANDNIVFAAADRASLVRERARRNHQNCAQK